MNARRVCLLWLGLALALMVARPEMARAQTEFDVAQISLTNYRAAESSDWDLNLAPSSQFGCFELGPPIRIEIDFTGSTDPLRPDFHLAGQHFVTGVTGMPGSTFTDSLGGDPVNGYKLFIIFQPADLWCSNLTLTFHLTGIVNAATGGYHDIYLSAVQPTVPSLPPVDVSNVLLTGTTVAGLSVQSPPPPGPIGVQAAGIPFAIGVYAVDRFGNQTDTNLVATVHDSTHVYAPHNVSLSSGGGVLNAVILTKSGTDYFVASSGVYTGLSQPFTVLPSAAHHFGVEPVPAAVVAHDPFPVAVEARDAYENTVPSYNGTAVSTDKTSSMTPTSMTFTAGVWTGNVVIGVPTGADSISVTDAPNQLVGRSHGFAVLPQVLKGFAVTAPPGPVTAGHGFPVSVLAVDSLGFTVTGYSGAGTAVTFSDSTGTFAPGTSGLFSGGAYNTFGTITRAWKGDRIKATNSGGLPGLSGKFDVNSGPYARLKITGLPDSVQRSVQFPITVAVVDSFDNAATGLAQTATLDDRKHAITPTLTGSLVSGSWTGNVSFGDTSAYDTVSASAAGVGIALRGKAGPVQVVPPGVSSFEVDVPIPSDPQAGQTFTSLIVALDAQGEQVGGFTGQVQLSDSTGTLSPTLSDPFVGGALNVALRITRSGGNVISVSDGAGHTGRSAAFQIKPGGLAEFAISVPAGPQTAYTAFPISVTAQDSFANVAIGFAGSVALGDRSGTLSPAQSGNFTNGAWSGPVTVGSGVPVDRISARFSSLIDSSAAFQVNSATPQILAASPPAIPPGGSATVRVVGHYFDPDATLSVLPDVTVTNLVRLSSDTLLADFAVAPSAAVGGRQVTVTQFNASASSDTVFSVNGFLPEVLTLSRPVLARTASVLVSVTGQHFDGGTQLSLGAGVTVGALNVITAESLTVSVIVDSLSGLGSRVVSASNSFGQGPGAELFHVVDRPTIDSLVPASAGVGDTVGIYGHSFETDGLEPFRVDLGAEAGLPASAVSGVLGRFVVPAPALTGPAPFAVHSYGAVSLPVSLSPLAAVAGDVNGDGRIDLADVALDVSQALGLSQFTGRALSAADCDGSGSVDVLDVLCIVDFALRAPRIVNAQAVPVEGLATWDAVRHSLMLPAGARAVLWRARCDAAEGTSAQAGRAGSWRVTGGYAVGVAGLMGEATVQLPAGSEAPTEVYWADSRGVVRRATLGLPAPPSVFQALGNPQQGRLWFAVPAHAGEALVELYRADGRRVAVRVLQSDEAGAVSWKPAGQLSAGLYFLRYQSGSSRATAKVVFLP